MSDPGMQPTPLRIEGAYTLQPAQFADDRGLFMEWFRQDVFVGYAGHPLRVQQANSSVSRVGVVRGIHFADIPPGQAKYVTCVSGTVFDVVVDIRIGSPTYGQWDSVVLDSTTRRAVSIAEGLGHAFMALSDQATVVYLCSAQYAPEREHGVHAFDPQIGVQWPTRDVDGRSIVGQLSPRDDESPSLARAGELGLLPTMEQAMAFYSGLA